MKCIIEIEDMPYSNGYLITENGSVVEEKKGELLFRAKDIPHIVFTQEELEMLEVYE